jgi:hypothetical protein
VADSAIVVAVLLMISQIFVAPQEGKVAG